MSTPDSTPKLRLAPREPLEEMVHRVEREKRLVHDQREADLEAGSLAPYRVGSVPYLNVAPLTRGLEGQVVFAHPSALAVRLRQGELDAAMLSVTEALFHDQYDVLDGVSMSSLGEVKSVFLAHRQPLEEIRVVHCDFASLTSVTLLRVLLAERGLRPEYVPLAAHEAAPSRDNVLLIGNQALDFLRAPHDHAIWDLGAAWFELTRLPFVFAVWVLRRGVDNERLRRLLREAKDFGLDTLDSIIQARTEYDLDFRKDYLGWHIHYHLAAHEKEGIRRFVELLRKHGFPNAHEPRYLP